MTFSARAGSYLMWRLGYQQVWPRNTMHVDPTQYCHFEFHHTSFLLNNIPRCRGVSSY